MVAGAKPSGDFSLSSIALSLKNIETLLSTWPFCSAQPLCVSATQRPRVSAQKRSIVILESRALGSEMYVPEYVSVVEEDLDKKPGETKEDVTSL
jgi:hypothetical protein